MPYQEKIVYLLGAGFSQPLGLPVISNFIQMAKDLYFRDPDTYATFQAVLTLLDTMGKVERYYHCNLFNIEKVLSILEMEAQVRKEEVLSISDTNQQRGGRELFAEFIRRTIVGSTPDIPREPTTWEFMTSGGGEQPGRAWSLYCAFVASLFGVVQPSVGLASLRPTGTRYALITLNYDMVLEKAAAYFDCGDLIRFASSAPPFGDKPILAKLHGSVEHGTIIPPTWNKVTFAVVGNAWQLAYEALAEATQIRVIGYSLPVHDSYVPYLLKAAVQNSANLKQIDVLCLDADGSVRKRYEALLRLYCWRFKDQSVLTYLSNCLSASPTEVVGATNTKVFNRLETVHEGLFRRP